ncbi:hypothetical protein SR70_04905 [Klebsiella aerogenes]|uniref:Uncharacterized protein n=1 Tax=Scandinavium lactucae TaxID=3095028 RepID=A0ABU4QS33_9ENTR|nr:MULTISPECIES: hypothetical protein [Enterobacteriaceae]KJP43608.1 hypothetical protein SR70_04905 [Klebsiella aerogenes]MDX6041063.1 hypothetical protein [Scandinavium sp. V105_6]MDX6050767.1 hypothetical protein [Scandinavium sp. V105_1]
MKRLLVLLVLLSTSAIAHAKGVEGTYKAEHTKYSFETLVVGPDKFKNRLRYWGVLPDGSNSVYWVVEKVGPGLYRETNVNADNEAIQLLFKNDTVTLQHRHVGKVVDFDLYRKVIE